jgi:hypothetical protein
MSYYLIHQNTGNIITDRGDRWQAYKTQAAAKACRTRVLAKRNFKPEDLVIVRQDNLQQFRHAHNIPTRVERVNIMTGKKFMEDIDTPYFCSPSSESYWSM